ncbi:hypothetical protein A2U01_0068437 [Trifolium medium]|uniref:Uncharacterized protein n=1 Tax=Trifolium medium TaxID=97028 RepID=A0A392SH61_9FABA|nr:hypothetical protein [Trifolium medium]
MLSCQARWARESERKREKASRSLKVPGSNERKPAALAGRACSVLESKVAV